MAPDMALRATAVLNVRASVVSKRCPPFGRQAYPAAATVVGHRHIRSGQWLLDETPAGDTGTARMEGRLPEQGRAAVSAEPSLLRMAAARELVAAHIAGFLRDLLVGKVG